jgi:amino acid transporter
MTANPYKKAFLLTTLYTLILAFIQYGVYQLNAGLLYTYQWYLLLYFYLITVLSVVIIEKTTQKDAEKLAKGFFSAMMLRLFVSVIIAIVIIYFDRVNSTIFALNFLILYLLYLGFEIYYLISILQPRLSSERQVEETE